MAFSAVMVTVLVVVIVVAIAGRSTDSAGPAGPPTSSADPSPAPITIPAGAANVEYRMPSWVGTTIVGPAEMLQPRCTTKQLTATASTRPTTGGVLGVVRISGALVAPGSHDQHRCSIPIDHGPMALLAADGTEVDVSRSADDAAQPRNPRSDLPPAVGRAVWGFVWLGSYCGPRGVSIEMPRTDGRAPLVVALTGAQPICTHGAAASTLIDGTVGFPGDPVEPARPEYAQLRLAGHIESGTSHDKIAPIDITVRTVGTTPVTLDPCPMYNGSDDAIATSGGFSDPLTAGYLPCTDRAAVITPGHPLHFTIPSTSLIQTPGTGAKPGTAVHVTLGIGGVPPLELTTVAG